MVRAVEAVQDGVLTQRLPEPRANELANLDRAVRSG